ncbi:MAG: transposase [Candidatus Margulisbacteria bacterium]|nr:transposase [Candidatus Margulisiibacteriota bacterium]
MLIPNYNNNNSTKTSIVLAKIEKTFIISHIDLSPVEELLQSLYSPDPRGRKPRDPVCILRSFILMVLEGETSITNWAETLRTDAFLSSLAGWKPGTSPSLSTFYKFLDRLQDGSYRKQCEHIHKASDLDKGLHSKNFKKIEKKKKPNKDHQKNDSVTQRLTEALLSSSEHPRQDDLLKRLEDILMELALKPSIEKGLIDVDKLEIAGDGSSIYSGANKNGRPSCKCFQEENKSRCECPRLYADPDADWGYDSYRKVYYYGDTFYQLCYSSKGHDLPVHLICGPASETDYTLSLKSFDRFLKTIREHNISCNISAAIFDAGHDALGVYQYFLKKNIPTIIPLNNRGAKNTYKNKIKLSDRAIPLCKGGLEMRHLGYNKTRMRHQFGCPIKRGTRKDGKYIYTTRHNECPLDTRCSPDTKHGPTVIISPKENPRLYPDIPRNSRRFKELYNIRGGTERSNSFKKVAYDIEKSKIKTRARRLIRLYLLSIVEHWKAIFKEKTKGMSQREIIQKFS